MNSDAHTSRSSTELQRAPAFSLRLTSVRASSADLASAYIISKTPKGHLALKHLRSVAPSAPSEELRQGLQY